MRDANSLKPHTQRFLRTQFNIELSQEVPNLAKINQILNKGAAIDDLKEADRVKLFNIAIEKKEQKIIDLFLQETDVGSYISANNFLLYCKVAASGNLNVLKEFDKKIAINSFKFFNVYIRDAVPKAAENGHIKIVEHLLNLAKNYLLTLANNQTRSIAVKEITSSCYKFAFEAANSKKQYHVMDFLIASLPKEGRAKVLNPLLKKHYLIVERTFNNLSLIKYYLAILDTKEEREELIDELLNIAKNQNNPKMGVFVEYLSDKEKVLAHAERANKLIRESKGLASYFALNMLVRTCKNPASSIIEATNLVQDSFYDILSFIYSEVNKEGRKIYESMRFKEDKRSSESNNKDHSNYWQVMVDSPGNEAVGKANS